jgi:uncharacterized protein (DUF58 family)
MTRAIATAWQEEAEFLDFRVRWRAGGERPGKHAARQAGAGGDFRAYRPFWQLPDAQRIDVRRSITDPFGDVLVRQMEQRSSITVVLAADVSRSMAPAADRSSLAAVSSIGQAACRSALRAGDAFMFLAFDRAVRAELSVPATRRRAAAREIAEALRNFVPDGRGAHGMLGLADYLPARRCLLLLASDFLMELDLLDRALASLAHHDIAPILLQAQDPADLPTAGLLRVSDAETGATQLLLMRPALHRRWREQAASRRADLEKLFRKHGRSPFATRLPIDIGALSRHLTDH